MNLGIWVPGGAAPRTGSGLRGAPGADQSSQGGLEVGPVCRKFPRRGVPRRHEGIHQSLEQAKHLRQPGSPFDRPKYLA